MAIPEVTSSLFGHYLAWMYQAMYSFNTIKSYTTAVKMWCRANRRPDPTLEPGTTFTDIAVADVWQAIKRLSKPTKRRFAVTFEQLRDVCRSCTVGASSSSSPISPSVGLNVAAAACLAWYGLLRGSEYTSASEAAFNQLTHACRSDVQFFPDNLNPLYIRFTVKNCKTDSIDRRGFVTTIYRSGTSTCAVMNLQSLFTTDPQPASAQLFRFNDRINAGARTPASIRPSSHDSSHRTLTKIFSRLLLVNGYNDDNVSSHSFRRGGATALFRSGASEYMVMQAGRWRSTCWRYYVDNDHTFYHDFASKMASATPTAGVHWDSETVPMFA
jgi:hypothetical protein